MKHVSTYFEEVAKVLSHPSGERPQVADGHTSKNQL